jgi:hypothetical protein
MVAPSWDLDLSPGRSHRLPAQARAADRLEGLRSDRASGAPSRRLGLTLWVAHFWTKPLINRR